MENRTGDGDRAVFNQQSEIRNQQFLTPSRWPAARLSDWSARRVRCRRRWPSAQPAAVAASVDALGVAQVEDVAALLRGMADDRHLARVVWPRAADLQRLPAEHVQRLVFQREVGQVIGVDEKMPCRFMREAAIRAGRRGNARESAPAPGNRNDLSVAWPPRVIQLPIM